jgi:hypothetical protein
VRAANRLELQPEPLHRSLAMLAEGVGPVADLEEEGEPGRRLDVGLADREDRLARAERHLGFGAHIRRAIGLVGDEHDEGAALLDRLLELLGIILAGTHVARRDPGPDPPRFDERAQIGRLVAVVRTVADEDVAGAHGRFSCPLWRRNAPTKAGIWQCRSEAGQATVVKVNQAKLSAEAGFHRPSQAQTDAIDVYPRLNWMPSFLVIEFYLRPLTLKTETKVRQAISRALSGGTDASESPTPCCPSEVTAESVSLKSLEYE